MGMHLKTRPHLKQRGPSPALHLAQLPRSEAGVFGVDAFGEDPLPERLFLVTLENSFGRKRRWEIRDISASGHGNPISFFSVVERLDYDEYLEEVRRYHIR